MSNYYREQGFHSRRPLFRHLKLAFWLIVLGLLVLAGFFAWDVYKQSQAGDTSSNLSKPINSTIVSNSSVQTAKYFQFQAPKRWRAIANETREGHYVYRQYNGPLVEQELVVDVDGQTSQVLALIQTTNVLPVTVGEKGNLQPTDISEHCKKYVKPVGARNQQIVTFNKVSFACSPDSTRVIAVVGLIGGNTIMKLQRPDGSTASYNITYTNLTATPSFRDMKTIVETFETR